MPEEPTPNAAPLPQGFHRLIPPPEEAVQASRIPTSNEVTHSIAAKRDMTHKPVVGAVSRPIPDSMLARSDQAKAAVPAETPAAEPGSDEDESRHQDPWRRQVAEAQAAIEAQSSPDLSALEAKLASGDAKARQAATLQSLQAKMGQIRKGGS